METNEIIKVLAADAELRARPLAAVWWGAVGLAVVAAAALFFALLGPRPDIAAAAETPRFLFKFVVTIVLASTAWPLVRALSHPGEKWRELAPYLAIGPILLAVAVVVELLLVPQQLWVSRLVGENSRICLFYVTLIGAGPLALFLLVLRHGAPTRPRLAGAIAGVLAGGIAATFYAAQCTDDSPLFVATWYTLAIGGLTLAGALLAGRVARW